MFWWNLVIFLVFPIPYQTLDMKRLLMLDCYLTYHLVNLLTEQVNKEQPIMQPILQIIQDRPTVSRYYFPEIYTEIGRNWRWFIYFPLKLWWLQWLLALWNFRILPVLRQFEKIFLNLMVNAELPIHFKICEIWIESLCSYDFSRTLYNNLPVPIFIHIKVILQSEPFLSSYFLQCSVKKQLIHRVNKYQVGRLHEFL